MSNTNTQTKPADGTQSALMSEKQFRAEHGECVASNSGRHTVRPSRAGIHLITYCSRCGAESR